MLLTLLGFGMVITFMTLIMTKRLSPLVALILVPIIFALLGGFGAGIDKMMLDGIRKIAPTGVMLMFAILYFGVMIDAGLFDPIVGRILRAVKGDPLKIVVGTTVLALVISLDGDGSTTYMIVVASMLPLYRRLKMNALSMTCLAMLASGVMNLTPWGGPTARAASALHVDAGEIFVPLVPVMGVAIVAILLLAFSACANAAAWACCHCPTAPRCMPATTRTAPRTCPRSKSTTTCAVPGCCGSTPA